MISNPLELNGIEFVEFASSKTDPLRNLFSDFGFVKVAEHKKRKMEYFRQNDIHFLINNEMNSRGKAFSEVHGPSICSMGWRVKDPATAFEIAVERGAKPCSEGDYFLSSGKPVPAIYGIGDSLIYFIKDGEGEGLYKELGFESLQRSGQLAGDISGMGFLSIDHLTNNVELGTMEKWADFYKGIFGFTEVRYFDIRGVQTGLQSYALRSPCGSFCIPINEAKEEGSQINEYLREYRGSGIQHLAFLTQDILKSLRGLQGTKIETLDIDNEYYQTIFDRVPNVIEDHSEIRKFQVLVDGDETGYLLQIFTKNLIGPIFIEIIQRKNYFSFGEGNFGALFRSIERDQMKRGVLQR